MLALTLALASVLPAQSCANGQCGVSYAPRQNYGIYTPGRGPAHRSPAPVAAPAPVKSWHRTAAGRTVWGWPSGGAILFHEQEQPAPATAAPRAGGRGPEVPIRHDAPPAPI